MDLVGSVANRSVAKFPFNFFLLPIGVRPLGGLKGGLRKMTTKKKIVAIQCKYYIQVLQGEVRYARHIATKHREYVEDYIHGR